MIERNDGMDDGMDDAARRPPGPVHRGTVATRPVSRPVSVWVLSAVLLLVAVPGLFAGVLALRDAVDHGDGDAMPASLARTAVATALLVCTLGVFVGARWGRTGVAAVCVLNFLGAVVSAMNGTTTGFALVLALNVNLVLGIWVLGAQVDAWTGATARVRSARPRTR